MRIRQFEGFEIIKRVVNLAGANGWEIQKASDHKAVLKWYQHCCKGFENNVEAIPVLADGENLIAHKEMD